MRDVETEDGYTGKACGPEDHIFTNFAVGGDCREVVAKRYEEATGE
jgi:hypothetical protein